MNLNLKAYIGAIRAWYGAGKDRHEGCNVTVAHPDFIVGGGHVATLRIDVARALVSLAEQTTSDRVLAALSDAIREAEAVRARIKADGTGRKRGTSDDSPKPAWESPLLKARTAAPDKAPAGTGESGKKRAVARRIATNALEAPEGA